MILTNKIYVPSLSEAQILHTLKKYKYGAMQGIDLYIAMSSSKFTEQTEDLLEFLVSKGHVKETESAYPFDVLTDTYYEITFSGKLVLHNFFKQNLEYHPSKLYRILASFKIKTKKTAKNVG